MSDYAERCEAFVGRTSVPTRTTIALEAIEYSALFGWTELIEKKRVH